MPVYEYRGDDSGDVVEGTFPTYADAPQTFDHEGETFRRIPSAGSFRLRGAFSGGSGPHNMHSESEMGTPDEIRRHAQTRKRWKNEEKSAARTDAIQESMQQVRETSR